MVKEGILCLWIENCQAYILEQLELSLLDGQVNDLMGYFQDEFRFSQMIAPNLVFQYYNRFTIQEKSLEKSSLLHSV